MLRLQPHNYERFIQCGQVGFLPLFSEISFLVFKLFFKMSHFCGKYKQGLGLVQFSKENAAKARKPLCRSGCDGVSFWVSQSAPEQASYRLLRFFAKVRAHSLCCFSFPLYSPLRWARSVMTNSERYLLKTAQIRCIDASVLDCGTQHYKKIFLIENAAKERLLSIQRGAYNPAL